MIDGFSADSQDKYLVQLWDNNPLLKFIGQFDYRTGEIYQYRQANFCSLKFEIHDKSRVKIKGSIHKFYNCLFGEDQNYDCFTLRKFAFALFALEYLFSINPACFTVHGFEIGINLMPSMNVDIILDSLIGYKSKPFDSLWTVGPGRGYICNFDEFRIKFYDPARRYGLNMNLLKFEKKIKCIRNFSKSKVYLSDLLDSQLWYRLMDTLIAALEQTIITDKFNSPMISEADMIFVNKYENHKNWLKLTARNRFYTFKKFNNLIDSCGELKIKRHLSQLIDGKVIEIINSDLNESRHLYFNNLTEEQLETLKSKL